MPESVTVPAPLLVRLPVPVMRARVRPIGGLIERDIAIVGDGALQAGRGTGERTGRDRRASHECGWRQTACPRRFS